MSDTKNNFGDMQSLDTGLEKWNAQEVSTESDPIDDPGTGKPYVIRRFEFHFDPIVAKKIRDKKLAPPTKQDLFNSVWPQLRVMLWADGLFAIEEDDLPPKIKVGKKKFTVVLVCEPRQGQVLVDKMKTLNEYLKND